MKRFVFILLLACAVMGAAFAQQKPAASNTPAKPDAPKESKNAIGLDAFQFLNGVIATDNSADLSYFIIFASYERFLVAHFSIGADLDMIFMDFDGTPGLYLGLSAEGRYYTSADFDKFFIGTTVGFNSLSIDGKTKPEAGGFSGLTASMKMGYKVITPKGFYLEPSLSYVLSKSSMGLGAFIPIFPTPIGWNCGLRIGFFF